MVQLLAQKELLAFVERNLIVQSLQYGLSVQPYCLLEMTAFTVMSCGALQERQAVHKWSRTFAREQMNLWLTKVSQRASEMLLAIGFIFGRTMAYMVWSRG
jgi:hypothetical protein